MIVTAGELRMMLGMSSSITDEEEQVLSLIHSTAESAVIEMLGYDPLQSERTELYPRHMPSGNPILTGGVMDVNKTHTQASLSPSNSSVQDTLQLEGLPIRKVTEVKVDYDARSGSASDAFANGTEWTQGDDFWAEWDDGDQSLCKSGMLIASGSWPQMPGTVKVTYVAGYSRDELMGRATADASYGSGGIVTKAGLNASGIRRAIVLTATNAMHAWAAFRKSARVGWTPGPMKSERLQDYSYTLGGAADRAGIGAMLTQVPPEAEQALEPFVNWGIKLRG